VCPRCLANRRPDARFGDVGGGLVVSRKKPDGLFAGNGVDRSVEDLGEESVDGMLPV
jgi:hypothetical protein